MNKAHAALLNHNSSFVICAVFPAGLEKAWLLLLLRRDRDKDV